MNKMDVAAMARGAREETTAAAYDAAHERGYPREYLEGITHFNAGRYYEAHEVWEAIWLRASGEEKRFYQMLIQAAVGLHHYDRGNLRGARSLYERTCDKLQQLPRV